VQPPIASYRRPFSMRRPVAASDPVTEFVLIVIRGARVASPAVGLLNERKYTTR
jgi:hypothetical protein